MSKQPMNPSDNFSKEPRAWARWALVLVLVSAVEGFALIPARNVHGPSSSTTRAPNFSRSRWSQAAENSISRRIQPLRMGKGFNGAKNKQLELAKKMALAKRQQQPDKEQQKGKEETPADDEEEEQRLQQDRARFAELLRTSKVSNPNPLYEDDELDNLKRQSRRSTQSSLKASVTARAGALNAKRSKSNITKAKKSQKKDSSKISKVEHEEDEDQPLQEGDIARRHDFEGLILCETGAALGPIVSAQLVPWVPPFTAENLIILADPRAQSSDLRRAIQYISSNVSPDILQQVIAINSDEVSVTKSWIDRTMTQQGGDCGSGTEGEAGLLRIFSDRNWEWMRRYSAVDDGRWSMSMVVIDSDAVIRKVIRDVDPSQACQLLAKAIEPIK